MLASINKDAQGTINCTQTTTSYILNRVLGLKTTAKNLNGVDEISGLQMAGRDPNIYSAIFDGIKKTQLLADTTRARLKQLESGETKGLNEINNLIPKGSIGIIHITGHVLNYEKTSSGVLKFIDPQINAIFTPDKAAKAYPLQNVVWNIFDCTNVSLKEGASDVLQYMVNM